MARIYRRTQDILSFLLNQNTCSILGWYFKHHQDRNILINICGDNVQSQIREFKKLDSKRLVAHPLYFMPTDSEILVLA